MLSLIVAIAQNDVIGKDNQLVWHLPEDLAYFKNHTIGKTILMGRKTFESFKKPLPNRKHIVFTKDLNYTNDHSLVQVCHDFNNICEILASDLEEHFVIGGATIYEQALPFCNKLYITRILKDFDGDTFLSLDLSDFILQEQSDVIFDEKSNIPFQFNVYKRH